MTVLTGTSKLDLSIPRDRAGTFYPKLIAKYQRRFRDFDAKIVSMYAHGMSVREIRGHLEELYGIGVSPDLISAVTDAVLEEVREWQNRPLDVCFPLVFFDAIRVPADVAARSASSRSSLAAGAVSASIATWMPKRCGVFWTRSGPDDSGSERRAGVAGDRPHQHEEGLPGPGVGGAGDAEARSAQWPSVRLQRPPRQPDQGSVARRPGRLPVLEEARARPLHLAVAGQQRDHDHVGPARLYTRRHQLAHATEDLAADGDGLTILVSNRAADGIPSRHVCR